jgi:hypothetical protein
MPRTATEGPPCGPPKRAKRFKERIASLLGQASLSVILKEVRDVPPRQAVSPLLAALYRPEPLAKWHAVSTLGAVVAGLAGEDREAARNVLRRLMWNLNDESGSTGWGAAEALAEILASEGGLAEEYTPFLVAYLRRDGLYLAWTALHGGLLWGIDRLAQTRPDLLRQCGTPVHLSPYLDSPEPEVRGLAAHALGLLQAGEFKGRLAELMRDPAEIVLYRRGEMKATTVGMLATEAWAMLA